MLCWVRSNLHVNYQDEEWDPKHTRGDKWQCKAKSSWGLGENKLLTHLTSHRLLQPQQGICSNRPSSWDRRLKTRAYQHLGWDDRLTVSTGEKHQFKWLWKHSNKLSLNTQLHNSLSTAEYCEWSYATYTHLHSYEHILADVLKLFFNLFLVVFCQLMLWLFSSCLLFNTGDDPPGTTPCPNHVFVGNREEIPFIYCERLLLLCYLSHELGV